MTMTRRAFALACAAGLAAAPAFGQGRGMVFATQESGTMFHTVASGIAKMLTETLNRRVAVQPYTGSTVYLPLLDSGEVTLGISSSLDVDTAWQGKDGKALKGLRSIARLMPLTVAFVVRADSGIKSAKDLKGKRVAVDLRAQRAMGQVTRAMLATAGLSDKDVTNVAVANVGESLKLLTEGNLDAAFSAVGIPLVKQAHSTISGGIAYVDLTGGDTSAAAMGKSAPGVYGRRTDPNPNLPEVKAPVTLAAFDIFILTGAKTPDADVTAILAALEAKFEELQKDYPALRAASVAAFSAPTNTAPFHPAAMAYHKGKGRWTAENDRVDGAMK